MKLAVVGNRTFNDIELMTKVLDRYRAEHPDLTIVSGAAPGADTLAAEYGRRHDLEVIGYPADWAKHGRRAGPLRNTQIVNDAEMLIAFWDEVSIGTRDSITKAHAKGVPVLVVTPMGREYRY